MSKKQDLLLVALCDISDKFDYSAIGEYYKETDWRWMNSEGEIPTADEIEYTVHQYIQEFVDKKHSLISSGGITIIKHKYSLMIYFCSKGDSESIKFGQIHDSESYIRSVRNYFDYMDKKK